MITTLNGKMVDWKLFDGEDQALAHYNGGVDKLRDMVQQSEEGDWEIMMCEVQQYAISKPQREVVMEQKETDWYARYLTIMSDQAKRVAGLRPRWTRGIWVNIRNRRSIIDRKHRHTRAFKNKVEEASSNNTL